MADPSQQLTQPATQPYDNPRRHGKNLSDMSQDDATDVICLLHPNSHAAFQAIRSTMLHGPEHILQNDGLENINEEDLLFNPAMQTARDFALRMSSSVRKAVDGFRFGRNPQLCDVLLTSDTHDKLISNVHFKIFVNSQGSLMIQDTSTNGTIVDDEHLKSKDRMGNRTAKPAMRALKNGSIICVLGGPGQSEIKLLVRLPNRGDNQDDYDHKLRDYLSQRGKVTNFASMRENTYGNHWNGGTMYNFTGILGKGAFATVYRVQTKNEGTIYAAKELDQRKFIKNGILDVKFDSELKIMKNLNHPHIVDYVDCQHSGHWIYIIMEYIPFGELSKELQERKSLPEPEVQQIAKQIMRALDYLHRRNITHRDIKPDNILFASRDPLVVKLSDFGLSKCVNDQETFLKTFCGTLLYCAPEIYPDYSNYMHSPNMKRRRHGEPAPKKAPYNQAVDMWSFGAVLYHVLCGKPPIRGKGDDRGAQMLNNIMTKEVDFGPLREVGVSEMAIDLIAQLLNRNPALRPTEKECLEHAWLKDIPDVVQYEPDTEPDIRMRRELDAVAEIDEDLVDEELMQEMERMTQRPANSGPTSSLSPQRPIKRPRNQHSPTSAADHVAYPVLPQLAGRRPDLDGGRLFGEIDQALLKSSGVFGRQLQSPVKIDELPDIREGIEQVSVNDYARADRPPNPPDADVPDDGGVRRMHVDHNVSAPSLLGAEARFGLLNMASPEAQPSDSTSPDTTNPVTPQTHEPSPARSVGHPGDTEVNASLSSDANLKFSRHIDVSLLNDEDAFAASVAARQQSRVDKTRQKAETFHFQPETRVDQVIPIELARTMHDGPSGLAAREATVSGPAFSRTIALGSVHPDRESSRPALRYGKLTPVHGSFSQQVIYLEKRMTSWGRGVDCTVRHPNVKDVRVPQYAIKMTFWAPGIERHEEQGGDWTQVPGIRTLVSTSTSKQIWVNDVELRKESVEADAALYGKIYTGDIITINQGIHTGEFLKYRVEITFGDSARARPDKELPFHIQHEFRHHRHAKERQSMRQSSHGVEQPRTPDVTHAVTATS